MISIIKQYWISILLSAVILVLCFIDTTPMPSAPISNFDKLAHFLMFLALSGAVYFDNTRYFKKPISYQGLVLGSFLFPLLFSGGVELMQEYISPYRNGDWMDFLYDGIGVFLGFAICLKINSYLARKTKDN